MAKTEKITLVRDKAKEARRTSRKIFGHLGHKIEQPKKGKGVKFSRTKKHRNKRFYNHAGVFLYIVNC